MADCSEEEDWLNAEEEALLMAAIDEFETHREQKPLSNEKLVFNPVSESTGNLESSEKINRCKPSRYQAVASDGRPVHQSNENEFLNAKPLSTSGNDLSVKDEMNRAVGNNGANEEREKDTEVQKGVDDHGIENKSDNLESEVTVNSDTSVLSVTLNASVDNQKSATNQDINKTNNEIVEELTPLQRFRGHYLRVTDLTSQAWCEQQLVYSFTVPTEVVTTAAMQRGIDMHLAKELEVHDIEQVVIETKEDRWAVKFFNILTSLRQLLNGVRCIREMPIFGDLYQMGLFTVGIIDEIRWTAENKLEIVEFKTRVKATLPSKAQKKTHRLQVSIYKYLFDSAVKGHLSKASIAATVGLDVNSCLSESVLVHTKQVGIESDQLGDVIDKTLGMFQFLPCIETITAEYMGQENLQPFASESYVYDEIWLKDHLQLFAEYWEGRRAPVGVDIEDAWKCHYCAFEDMCQWKEKMIQLCVERNKVKKVKVS